MRWIGLCTAIIYAQGGVPIGQWGIYAYHGYIHRIGYVAPYFWFLSGEGVVLLDGETGSYRELSRVQGLLHNRPTALYSDPYAGWIFLGYADGQIQYGKSPEALEILRDIAVNPFYTSRAIRDFAAKGETLAIATDFGLVLWDKRQRRVLATIAQFPNKPFAQPVLRTWWGAGRLWAFLADGLYALPEGRPWTGPWEAISITGRGDTASFYFGCAETPHGFLLAYKDSLYRWSGMQWEPFQLEPPLNSRRVLSIYGREGGWAISLDTTEIFYFGQDGKVRSLWNPGAHVLWMDPSATHIAAGSSWIGGLASSEKHVLSTDAYQRLRAGRVTEVLPTLEGLFFLHEGTGFWGPGWGNMITFYPHGATKGKAFFIPDLIRKAPGGLSRSAWDGERAWILSGSLILRLAPSGAVDTFTVYNAPFDGLIPDANGKPTIMGFSAIAIENNGTVWIGKRYGIQNLLCYIPQRRQWIALSRSEEILDIRIDGRGYKWILAKGGKIIVLADHGQPEMPVQYRIVVLGEGGQPLPGLPSLNIQVIAPDRTGAVWLGTDKGVAVLYGDPFAGTLSVTLPVIENRYLLEEESITDIAVDGQNRKWIGTYSSGVYVLSPDGSRQLASFTSTNSPLSSNLIYRIRSWDYTGEIFIITSDGTVSYRDFSTEPAERLDSVYVFPNPVSRNFSGWVGIRGLSEGSTVRIFTPDGQTVRYLQAFGGQAVWDLRTISGDRISPGIYLIGALDREGQRSALGKIVVID